MRSVNKVILVGNLTRDPEMRQTPNGQNVTTFGLATNRRWATKEGEQKDSAEFHECVAWSNLAEICSKLLKKGALIYVEGYLKTRSWDTPEGVKKFKTEIVVQDMIMLEKKKAGENDDEYVPAESSDASNETEEAPAEEETAEAEEPVPSDDDAPAEGEDNPIDKDLGL